MIGLPPPWEDCTSIPLNSLTPYSLSACKLECLKEYLLSKCDCIELYMNGGSGNLSYCTPKKFEECVEPKFKEYIKTQPPCQYEPCKSACEEIMYSPSESFTFFSAAKYNAVVKQYGQDVAYWKTNLVAVQIHYTQMMQEFVDHQPGYSGITLLCDVGGAFGLIIGASLVSVLEVFDFFIMMCLRKGQSGR
jgi:hypothetical protein